MKQLLSYCVLVLVCSMSVFAQTSSSAASNAQPSAQSRDQSAKRAEIRKLIERSKILQASVRRLDATMHAAVSRTSRGNPVEQQLHLLKAAFEEPATAVARSQG